MAAIVGSFVQLSVKAIIFAGIAYAGIICGKKFRDKKDAGKVQD